MRRWPTKCANGDDEHILQKDEISNSFYQLILILQCNNLSYKKVTIDEIIKKNEYTNIF